MTSQILLTMQPRLSPINNGAVVFSRETILAIGPTEKIIRQYPGHRILHLKNSILLPGLVNVHTHLELPPILDLIRARTYADWVLNLIKTKRVLGNNDYALAARQNIKTLIRTGATTVADICTHNVSPALLRQSKMRALIYREVIAMDPSSLVPRLSSLVSRPSSLVRHGISPHAPHTVSEQVLRKLKDMSIRKKLRLCMHVAESRDEIKLLQGKKSGLDSLYNTAGWDKTWAPSADSPFEYLHRLGLLNPHLLAVHAAQATDKDISLIRKSRVPIAHCPRSNKELGGGRMPLKRLLDAGITVGLGTDSLASSPNLSMWDEMRYAYRIHQRDGVTPKDIFSLATMGGAKALGMNKEIGSLEAGKRADIIAVPLPEKDTGDVYSDLLRETKSCIMTMVNGKILYQDTAQEKR
jgi:cytosine/adenosine deaminase-related metal-dependent hydrolase